MTPSAFEFEPFLASLKGDEARAALSPVRLAEALDLSLDRLADVARVHRATIHHAPHSPRLQDTMSDIVRVLAAAQSLNGSLDTTLFWFRNQPIREFRYFTPLQVVGQGKADDLVRYLESIAGGAAG